MPILKRPGKVTAEQMKEAFEAEILDSVDERDREIIRQAIQTIKRCAVEEATNGTTPNHHDR